MRIRIGHSPDPDDAFMLYALTQKRIEIRGLEFSEVVEDIESLNRKALEGELEVTAISAHAYALASKHYLVLKSGASMGEGYGPIVVAKNLIPASQLRGLRISVPGKLTTAQLLLRLAIGQFEPRETRFDQVFEKVISGESQAGLIIHEGQLTYDKSGLKKILDLAEWWAGKTGTLPLPLGLDAVKRSLGFEMARTIRTLFQDSIQYAWSHREEALDYAMEYSRGTKRELVSKFVDMYVNQVTYDMGERGATALRKLYDMAAKAGLVPQVELDIV